MDGLNSVTIMGNVGQDPEVKTLNNGSVVANFSIATNKTYKDTQGQKQQNTEWHRIELWNVNAQLAQQYVRKGNIILIQGEIKTDRFTDNQGVDRSFTKIRGHKMLFIPTQNGGGQNMGDQQPAGQPNQQPQPQQPAQPAGQPNQQPQPQQPAQPAGQPAQQNMGQEGHVDNAKNQAEQYVTKDQFMNDDNENDGDDLPF